MAGQGDRIVVRTVTSTVVLHAANKQTNGENDTVMFVVVGGGDGTILLKYLMCVRCPIL